MITGPTNKSYIGVTKFTAERRWSNHINTARRGSVRGAFQNAILKYGPESFLVKTLAIVGDWPELLELEKRAVDAFGTMSPNGYNMAAGGKGGLRGPISEEARANAASSQKRRYESPEQRAILTSNGRKGSQVSAAKAKAITAAKKAAKRARMETDEYKQWRYMRARASQFSPDARARFLEAVAKRVFTPEMRDRMSKARVGTKQGPCSDRRKQLIGAAQKRSWADPEKRAARIAATAHVREAIAHDPEIRARTSASVKALWSDPVYREKQLASLARARAAKSAKSEAA